MIRRADLEQLNRDALVMDLDDLRSRGEAIIAEASAHAQRVIANANTERQQLIATAHQEGFEQGHSEGLAAGHAEGVESGGAEARAAESAAVADLIKGWAGALNDLETNRDQLLREARTDVVRLAVQLATRVVRRSVDIDPRAVEPQMEAVLQAVARPTRLVMRVNPDDLAAAERAMPQMLERFASCEHAQITTDATIGRGSLVATTEGGGCIDASVEGQLERMVAELLPDDPELLGESADESEPNQVIDDPRSDAA